MCRETSEQATALLEGQLPFAALLRVRFHLWICRHCRRYLRQLERVVAALRRLEREAPSEEAVAAIVARALEARRGRVAPR